MEGATSNPWLIAVINMTIVFGVLIVLGGIMKLIQLFDCQIMGTK
jgi:glutaconyl-CoA/methylmalonyl-CoA decarboxylase subunit delta